MKLSFSNKLFLVRVSVYALGACGLAFDTATESLKTAQEFLSMDWFQLLKLSLRVNGQWVLVVVAAIDGAITVFSNQETKEIKQNEQEKIGRVV